MSLDLKNSLPEDLQARLNVIIQRIPLFWEQKRYNHFTNHGVTHSERIYKSKLAVPGLLSRGLGCFRR